MIDVIFREETLLNVVKSVTRNGRSIVLTALLALVLVYLFSIVGFMFFREDFYVETEPSRLEEVASKGNDCFTSPLLLYLFRVIVVGPTTGKSGTLGIVLKKIKNTPCSVHPEARKR